MCRNIELTLDENGTAILEASQVNNGSTDNCSTLNYLINGETSITFDCNSIGENIVTLEVSDGSEHSENSFCEANFSFCSQNMKRCFFWFKTIE